MHLKIYILFSLCTFLMSASNAQRSFRNIDISITGDAQILLVDSVGRKTGNDPLVGRDYFEIPNATFMTGGVDSENPDYSGLLSYDVLFKDPPAGAYFLKVTGYKTGTFKLVIALIRAVVIGGEEHDTGETFQFSGDVTRGSIHEYRIYYDPDTMKAIVAEALPMQNGLVVYSLFATHSLWLEQNSSVYSGDVGVNEAGSPPFLNSEVELTIGIGTSTSPGYSVKANQIQVKQGATVGSDVYYNTLDNNGTISGSLHTPLSLPLVTTLPEFKTSTPSTQDVTVPQNGSQILQPGNYGYITVKKNGVLTFTGGVYHFNSFNGGDNAQILFQGASEVRIAGKFDTDQGTYLGPQDTTTLSASQIIFYVAGINGSNGNLGATPKAAQIGISNTVKANFYVPNGTLWIRQNSEAIGAFIGKDVDVGIGVKIWIKSAF